MNRYNVWIKEAYAPPHKEGLNSILSPDAFVVSSHFMVVSLVQVFCCGGKQSAEIITVIIEVVAHSFPVTRYWLRL